MTFLPSSQRGKTRLLWRSVGRAGRPEPKNYQKVNALRLPRRRPDRDGAILVDKSCYGASPRPSVATYKANAIDKAVPSARRQAIRNPRQIRISAGCFQYRYCPASDFFASCGGAPPVPRSSMPFLCASYSGVPGRGGTPFGRPPAHSGIISTTLPTLASRAPLAQEASAVPRNNNATRRTMTTDEGTFDLTLVCDDGSSRMR